MVQRRPWVCGSAALLVLVVLAVPLFSMRLAFTDAGNDPTKLTTRQAYDLLAQGFGPGFNGPLVVAAVIILYPTTSPQAAETASLVRHLRGVVIPPVVGGAGVTVLVGGVTAAGVDASHYLSNRLPLVIGLVILLAFVLLMAVFRSVAIPIKAAIMNLLSMGAADGVIVAVFQWGWLGSLFGVSRTGPIDPWIPLMMFTIVFGLSMDYEVFLLLRIRE